jgi:hypothetical protein
MRAYTVTKQVDVYEALGPNSNTWAAQMLTNAGYAVPKPPGATGWNYDGEFKYGGTYFTSTGDPTPAYDPWKKAELYRQAHAQDHP